MEFLAKLGIDLKLLIAQIINFLLLLVLLRIFLYKPLLKNLEERTKKAKKIEEGEREIQIRKKEMEDKEEEMIKRTREKTTKILEEAETISKEERKRILEQTEKEIREILKDARERAKIVVEKTRGEEKKRIKAEAVDVLRRVLPSAFSWKLHQEYSQAVIRNLKTLDFKNIKDEESIFVLINTAYPLNKSDKEELKKILFSKLGFSAFEEKIDPSLIAGFSINVDGFFLDGTLAGKLEKSIYG